ncbi:MAG TPA: hypothetical protein VGW58_03315 [Pyrinomonadaceae bacterium]|nr:hypothetical protein [Pyrinomonadaceae bacterium]
MTTAWEKLLRGYSKADWVAHLIVSTWLLAVFNFETILAQQINANRTYVVDGMVFIGCILRPPPAHFPRFITMVALSVPMFAAFGRTISCRVITSIGLASALGVHIFWWLSSYRSFLNFEDAGFKFLSDPEIRHTAYLYGGTPEDLTVVLSISVCLVLALERLFDRGSGQP